MRVMLIAWAFVVALAAAPGASAQDHGPLAQARLGHVQCFEPVVERKVCGVLSSYQFAPDGTISNVADMLVLSDPLVIMHMASPVEVRGAAVCGPLRDQDLASATFTVNGAPASAEDAESIRRAITRQMEPMMNVEVCTTFAAVEGGALRADSNVAGVPHPEMSQAVLWVNPAEGWRVGE